MEFTSHCQFGDNLVGIMQYLCYNLPLEGWKKKFGVEWLMVQFHALWLMMNREYSDLPLLIGGLLKQCKCVK